MAVAKSLLMDKVLLHLLVLSLAVNVGLISILVYDGETSGAEQSTRGFLLENEKKTETSMADSSEKEAHGSERAGSMTSSSSSTAPTEDEDGGEMVINVDHGDPTMYESFWQHTGQKTTVVISGWQSLSYFSDVSNLCWFLEPELAKAIIRLHKLVGNAVTDGRYIVVGTGSTQLFQAALYALSPTDVSEPISVVSAAPYYSSYPLMTDFLKSGLYKWDGDANKLNKDKPYIEIVTSPNNPDGHTRQAVVNGSEEVLIHDLAYYWPQYTPISFPAGNGLMLFTVSKSTGHAGTRIGWALVKDQEVAKKMTKFIELNTIGVSKDSQLRAAKILQAVSDSCDHVGNSVDGETFFEYSHKLMSKRWKQLRAAVKESQLFSLPDFAIGFCSFSGRNFEPQPAFAWLKCEREIEDCESFLRAHKIVARGGKHFGVSPKYVRISITDRDKVFDLFTERLSKMHPPTTVFK